jgi:hypothetical protein
MRIRELITRLGSVATLPAVAADGGMDATQAEHGPPTSATG